MGKPRSNNLQTHLSWALSNNAFKATYSFWDTDVCRASATCTRVAGTEVPLDAKPAAAAAASNAREEIFVLSSDGLLSDPAFITEKTSLPTPPLQRVEVTEDLNTDSDSDLEFLAHLSSNTKTAAGHRPSETDARDAEDSQAAPGAPLHCEDPADFHFIETSSAPSSPKKINAAQEDLETPKFRLTQAMPSDLDVPKQEIGTVLSEKIALLEQKIRALSLTLSQNSIKCDTTEVDSKIAEVERRIEQFPGDEDSYDVFHLSSSPGPQQTSAGLPAHINNDEFDSDFSISAQEEVVPAGAGIEGDELVAQTNRSRREENQTFGAENRTAFEESEHNDEDDVEILGFELSCQDDEMATRPVNSLGDEDSIYRNRLEDDSIVIATNTVLPLHSQLAATQRQPHHSQSPNFSGSHLGEPNQYAQHQLAQNQHMQHQHMQHQPMQHQYQNSQLPPLRPVHTHSNHPWTKETVHILRTKFGLQGFRPNQAEAVNETLAGNDVVVLMPTGGGKSLCYQLPALVTSGSTRGTTIVISPLISLMQDQVYHLKNRNIQAEMLNSKLSASERAGVFQALHNCELQLLYISPEMLSISGAIKSALQKLYTSNRLARIVIDEAHCVSAWGHDFRPEYMELNKVKNEFPTTPIMALTATANERVLLDIVGCLRANPMVLKQSFNRRNLFYEVRPKTASVTQEIAEICRSYGSKSGIIYCNSKRNCEELAAKLRQKGVSASFYHAGMGQEDRYEVQRAWQQGRCAVVCATIAFGMGIDKPDVRYVMHMTLPRNIEGYYQETGRAGRDGKLSQCVLFYSYRDVQMLQKMIQQDAQHSNQVREHHRALLIRVMQYCENKTDCRRQQVLQYFNEDFDPKLCRHQCDNCRSMSSHGCVNRNMTAEAKLVVEILRQIVHQNITTQQLTDVLLGRKTQKAKSCGLCSMPWFGAMHAAGALLVERLVHALVSERVIEEFSRYNHSRFPQSYIRLGPMASAVTDGTRAINLSMPRDPAAAREPEPATPVRKRPPRGAFYNRAKRSRR